MLPVLIFALLLWTPTFVVADDKESGTNYANEAYWICHPDKGKRCASALDTAVVSKNGIVAQEKWQPATQPAIDCFYVYPTVSADRRPNSDLLAGADEELKAVREQFQRFASQCRLFAPIYRQRTLPSLMAQVPQGDPRVAYRDIKDAWLSYLKDAPGRGFVLIGHSQGAELLKKLVKEEIDGKPIKAKLVSAILLGTAVTVSPGKDTGGDFQSIPACRSPTQVHCVISYSAFRKSAPPATGAAYGRHPFNGNHVLCTNPAALEGSVGTLRPYFPSRRADSAKSQVRAGGITWLAIGEQIKSEFVTLPDMLTARCVSDKSASYLEVTVHHEPGDKRAADIGGDMYYGGQIQPQWGLHLIDLHLALGNLVEIVGQQSRSFEKR
jgi:hypothetical protein